MKTVLFVDKDEGNLWSSFSQYDFVIDEYRRRGHFEVCDWHPEGRSVATAVPTLEGLVSQDEEWAAIVVCDLRGVDETSDHDPHFDNPFDFERNYDKGINEAVSGTDETPPLVRLTQMLGGIPDKSDWVRIEQGEGSGVFKQQITHPRPDSYYQMLEDYRLGVPRPVSIICVTPRSVDEDYGIAREKDLGDMGLNKAYQSDFWQRNDYAISTRFVVCDRIMPAKRHAKVPETEDEGAHDNVESAEERLVREAIEHREGSDWLQFWVSVLTLMVADMQSEHLKPNCLYRLQTHMDFEGIQRVFDRRYSEWLAAREHVSKQMDFELSHFERSEYQFVQIPMCDTDITVDFDLVNTRDLLAKANEVHLIRDVPRNDHEVWNDQRLRISGALGALLRAPRRALRIASRRFREQSSLDPKVLEYCILNQTEREELVDDLLTREIDLARSTGKRAFRLEAYDNSLDAHSAEIRAEIEKRPKKRFIVGAFVAAVVAVIMGLLPYFLGLWLGLHEGVGALVTTLLFVSCLALVLFATLTWQKRLLQDAYSAFNDWIHGVLDVMRGESERLGKRISDYATFRKLWSILDRQDHLNDPTTRARWLGQKDAMLQTRIRDIETVLPVDVDPAAMLRVRHMPWTMVVSLLDDESFYNVYSSSLTRCPFNEHLAPNQTVLAPFEFVTSVELESIQIW